MDFTKFLQSGAFKKILWAIGALAIAFLIFNAGVAVGFQKASFAEHMEQDYADIYGGHGRAPGGFLSDDFASNHAAAGKIVTITLPTFTVADRDGTEKTVLITDDTSIREFKDTLQASDLAEKEFVVVIGSPNDKSQIEARLIRIIPPPPGAASSTTNAANATAK